MEEYLVYVSISSISVTKLLPVYISISEKDIDWFTSNSTEILNRLSKLLAARMVEVEDTPACSSGTPFASDRSEQFRFVSYTSTREARKVRPDNVDFSSEGNRAGSRGTGAAGFTAVGTKSTNQTFYKVLSLPPEVNNSQRAPAIISEASSGAGAIAPSMNNLASFQLQVWLFRVDERHPHASLPLDTVSYSASACGANTLSVKEGVNFGDCMPADVIAALS